MAKTFRDGVVQFWKWFPTVADQFARMLDDQQGEKVVSQVQRKLQKWMPSMCWVCGHDPPGHTFTLTGEGQQAKQLLAEFWLTQAVPVSGWKFYASKQASTPEETSNFAIRVGENMEVDCERFVVSASVDEEHQCINITAWHPTYAELGEEHHLQILYIFLDELLGEFGTQTWIGEILVEAIDEVEAVRPLAELPGLIESATKYHNWHKPSPLESYTLYEAPELRDGPRGDTLFGSTCIPQVLFQLLNEGGKLSEDPTGGAGAEFAYIAIDRSVFQKVMKLKSERTLRKQSTRPCETVAAVADWAELSE